MLASNLLSLLPLALSAMASPLAAQAAPAFPPASYLFTVNLTSGPPVELGQTPLGQRNFGPISGGTFAGPGLSGECIVCAFSLPHNHRAVTQSCGNPPC